MVDREACDAAEKKKCLIVQGARQVGKTFVMEEFTAEEYEELPEINFKKTPSAMEIFSGDLSVEAMHTGVHNFKCKGHLHGRTGGYAHD